MNKPQIGGEEVNRDNITLKDIDELKAEIAMPMTIREWKIVVKRFAVKHGLTDREAIDIARG
jgi:hypothetical protein